VEAFFNLAWLVTALLAVGLWALCPAQAQRRSDRTRQCIALLVLLAVLFPVISLTDDFQGMTVWAEAEGGARRLLTAGHSSHLAEVAVLPPSTSLAFLTVPSFSGEFDPTAGGTVLPAKQFWLHATAIRPPPAV
jgi:nitrate reductase NapE component